MNRNVTVTSPKAPLVQVAAANDWASVISANLERIRTGDYRRFGKLEALCFAYTRESNPRMLELGLQKTPEGRAVWPGKNLDWMGAGSPIAYSAFGLGLLLTAVPFPLPPWVPDGRFAPSLARPKVPRIPQRIKDRALRISGTRLLCIQPVTQIHWLLDSPLPGHGRREVQNVGPDVGGISMSFIYDPATRSAHLVGGRVI